MLGHTHLAFGVFLMLLFLPFAPSAGIFVAVILFASLLPDVDSETSIFGRRFIARPIQFFVRHRGVLHSFTFMFGVTGLLYVFYLEAALPFALGYGGHLIADMVTIAGIKPLWPFNLNLRGFIRTGGFLENIILFVIIVADLGLFYRMFL